MARTTDFISFVCDGRRFGVLAQEALLALDSASCPMLTAGDSRCRAPAVLVRGRSLPCFQLHECLGHEPARGADCHRLVLEHDGALTCLETPPLELLRVPQPLRTQPVDEELQGLPRLLVSTDIQLEDGVLHRLDAEMLMRLVESSSPLADQDDSLIL